MATHAENPADRDVYKLFSDVGRRPRTAKLVRRRMYRPERPPARKKGVFKNAPPVGALDATPHEVITSIAVVCKQLGVRPGQGGEYDPHSDYYALIGQDVATGKAQDFRIPGHLVASVIKQWRKLHPRLDRTPRDQLIRSGFVAGPKPVVDVPAKGAALSGALGTPGIGP